MNGKELFEEQKEIEQANAIKEQHPDLFEPEKSKLYKFDFKTEIDNLVNRALEDFDDPLAAYKTLHKLEKQVKSAKEKILNSAISEAEKYEKNQQKDMGFSVTNTGRYDYKTIPEWVSLDSHKKAKEKQFQLNYKQMQSGLLNWDEDTGAWFDNEGIEVFVPSYTPSKTSLKFTKL